MAEEAEGMNAVESDHEVTASAKAGQAEGDQQTANEDTAEEEGKLNQVNSWPIPAYLFHSIFIQY